MSRALRCVLYLAATMAGCQAESADPSGDSTGDLVADPSAASDPDAEASGEALAGSDEGSMNAADGRAFAGGETGASVTTSTASGGEAVDLDADEDGAEVEQSPPTASGPEDSAEESAGQDAGVPATAGEEDSSIRPSAEMDELSCEAQRVLQQRCQQCHGATPSFGAPMSLLTRDDFLGDTVLPPTKPVLERVAERVHDTSAPMPPLPEELAAEELALLDEWLAAGAPFSECEPAPELGSEEEGVDDGAKDDFEWPADCEERYLILTADRNDPAAPYPVPASTEEHPQFIFDAPWGDDPVQLVASRPVTDNAKVLHHWILYDNQADPSFQGAPAEGKFLVGWAPGNSGDNDLPADVGVYLPSGRNTLRLDVHYYNLVGDQVEPDRSGVELCVTRNFRTHTATTIGLIADATVPATSRVSNVRECSAQVAAGSEVHFLSVSPHMHKLGVHASLELDRGGETTVLHDAPFQFDDQRVWSLNNIEIVGGDVLRTTCVFENPSDRRVTYGDGSDDEMCFNWIRYYPIGAITCGFPNYHYTE